MSISALLLIHGGSADESTHQVSALTKLCWRTKNCTQSPLHGPLLLLYK